MIRPPYLRKGDTLGITAPAGALNEAEIASATDMIRSWGLKVFFGEHLFRRRHSFAGTDNQRAADLQRMLDDSNIKAILCARGGYGTVRIIDRINFDGFIKQPKWIAGYSDITVLHAALQQRVGAESIHGAMPRAVPPKIPDLLSFDSLRAMLFGEVKEYSVPGNTLNIEGEATGVLVGGNLSILYSIAGSVYEPDTQGKILFIEDLDEYLYHIDRMMMNLKIRGKLSVLKGIIVGDMMDMKGSPSGFNKKAYRVIKEAVQDYGYPVMFGFPAGHGVRNLALPLGRQVSLIVSKKSCFLTF